MKNILFIHQSAELYGSDKTLLLLIKNLDKSKFHPVVILPFNGPLVNAFKEAGIHVEIAPVLKLYRNLFKPKNALNFLLDIKKSFKAANSLNNKYQFDFIYSNTLAVLLGVAFAWKKNVKHIWHVHEIIESPTIFKKMFINLLSLKSNTHIVYNSIATQQFWNLSPSICEKNTVIWNGIELEYSKLNAVEIQKKREEKFNSVENEIIIALVGRISRWKGQMILLEAFNKIACDFSNVKLAIIGSPPPNQEIFLFNLENKITEYQLNKKVVLIPFQNNISEIWQSIDIAVVPSTEPEPFGMVAIEAMLAEKAVIGSNHGGLSEIIVDKETGFLITPNNVNELEEKLIELISNEALRNKMGQNGFKRVKDKFSVKSYVNSFQELFNKL
ncbi:MAG: glycosyltransferase family 4 protein [Flavobacterium sp.]|jgi:glycosyltransferase involved in cell wall biosynthesis